jgi:hypothetical protein
VLLEAAEAIAKADCLLFYARGQKSRRKALQKLFDQVMEDSRQELLLRVDRVLGNDRNL